jgi:hypothetical protein
MAVGLVPLLKDRNTRGEAVAERDGEPTRDCDREAVAVTLKPRVGDRDGDAAREAEAGAERDRETVLVTLKPRVGDRDGDGTLETEADAERVLETVAVTLKPRVGDRDVDAAGDVEALRLLVNERACEEDLVAEARADRDADRDAVRDGLTLGDGMRDGVSDLLAPNDTDGVCVTLGIAQAMALRAMVPAAPRDFGAPPPMYVTGDSVP